jgi:hypothetical protein
MTARIVVEDVGAPEFERARILHQFSTTWIQTKTFLAREVEAIAAPRDWTPAVTICRSGDAVVVSFPSRFGRLSMASGRYMSTPRRMPGWQANVRAVALTLEALRTVNRHGVAVSGEQYAGFERELSPGS